MKVFVAGASGVIGRRLVPMLVQAGHQVTGMTRRPERADQIRALGAEAAVCDVFDGASLTRCVTDAAPEVVVHELTDLPSAINMRKPDEMYSGNDRLRSEGTRNLVEAAVAAGAARIVAQSIAFAYEPTRNGLKTENDPLFDSAPFPWSRSVQALHDLEDAVTKTPGIEGIVLRYGFFYGPGSSYSGDGHLAGEARKRRLPRIQGASGVFSFIHVDDAASATLASLDRGVGGGIYNIVDDDPAPVNQWIPAFAQAVGAKQPRRVPQWLARIFAGGFAMSMLNGACGVSNERAKRELGWTPRYASWREGFRQALG
ncbi:MAG: NAD(P)-dependent oxidoreductase [Solirubrobacterales bacterium]